MTVAQRRKAEQVIKDEHGRECLEAETSFAQAVQDALASRDDRIVIANRVRALKLRELKAVGA